MPEDRHNSPYNYKNIMLRPGDSDTLADSGFPEEHNVLSKIKIVEDLHQDLQWIYTMVLGNIRVRVTVLWVTVMVSV